ncbi:glycosyltransferase family 2 protein [Clostridium felsineum]|uniref:glycosyltransferase family 2 protein n=1 Tax=Clostridium felsineum TaxID=36839 RepID=UPI00159122BA|nr:glycosyltransferase family 2 protein [Clostridium felsineum]MCR3759869.1 glycosyltransferase family 2 protein [Clostridium felsineum]
MITLDISIIIVNYNTEDLLRNCLNSIKETVENVEYEVIVTDNDSKDGSVKMMKNEFPWVKLIESKVNGGFAYANNLAIKQSSGKYIFLLNSDTVLLKDVIEKMIKYMNENKVVGLLGPKLLNRDMTHQTSVSGFPTFKREFYHIYKLKNILKIPLLKKVILGMSGKIGSKDVEQYMMNFKKIDQPREVQVLVGAALLVRREVIDKIGMLDERYFMYYEEIDFCYQASKAGFKAVYYPHGEIIHYIGQSSNKIKDITFYERYKSMIKYFRKNHGKFKEILVRINLVFGLTFRMIGNIILLPFKRDRYILSIIKIYFNTIKIGLGFDVNTLKRGE